MPVQTMAIFYHIVFFSLLILHSNGSIIKESYRLIKDYLKRMDFARVNIYSDQLQDISKSERRLLLSLPAIVEIKSLDLEMNLHTKNEAYSLSILFLNDEENKFTKLKTIFGNGSFLNKPWLIFGDPYLLNTQDTVPYFSLDNEAIFFSQNEKSKNQSAFLLFETYQASSYLPFIIKQIGRWNEKAGLYLDTSDPASRRTNLTGLFLRCVTLPQIPFVNLSSGGPGEKTEILSGYAKDVWDNLQETFGFKYSCRRPIDSEWGTNRNGRWTGLVREVHEGYADVIVSSLDFTTSRSEVLDYLLGLKTIGYSMVVRRPGLMESTWTNFTSELGMYSWLATIALIILSPFFLVFVSKYSPFECKGISFEDAYILTLGALTFQGSWLNVSSASSRIAFITIFFGGLLIYSHYTSALVAQLTVVSESSTSFTTLQGLRDTKTHWLGFLKGSGLEDDFRDSTAAPFNNLWKDIILPKHDSLPTSAQEGLYMVQNENYVHMMEKNEFYHNFYDQCDVTVLPYEYFSTITGIAFAKNSPYVKVFNNHLIKLRDSGMLERYWQRWQTKKSLCDSIPLVALSLNQTSTAFLVLLLGIISAIIVCLPLEKYLSLTNKMKSTVHLQHIKLQHQAHPFDSHIDYKDTFSSAFK